MINLKELRALTVPVPPLDLQAKLGRDVAVTLGLVNALEAEVNALGRSRAALLTELLSGTTTIPESYDALMEEPG